MEDVTSKFDQVDIAKNKTNSILSYIGFLVLVPLFTKDKSPVVRFCMNQGLIIFAVELIASIVVSVLSRIPAIGVIFTIVGGLLNLVCFAAAIFCIVGLVNGNVKKLPIIGDIQIIK